MLLANATLALQLRDGAGGWWQWLVPLCHLWATSPPVPPVLLLLSIISLPQLLCVTQQNSPAAVSSPVGEVGHVIHDTFFVSGGAPARLGPATNPSSTGTFTRRSLWWEQMRNVAANISPALQNPPLPPAASLAQAAGGNADADRCAAAGCPSPAVPGDRVCCRAHSACHGTVSQPQAAQVTAAPGVSPGPLSPHSLNPQSLVPARGHLYGRPWEQRRGEEVKPRDQENLSCGEVTDVSVTSERGRRTVSLKESSHLQQDGHLVPRVALTGVPSLWRGWNALRCQPTAGTPSTTSGTWLEHMTCILNRTSAPHDIVPPPPVSPQPALSQPPRQRGVDPQVVGKH